MAKRRIVHEKIHSHDSAAQSWPRVAADLPFHRISGIEIAKPRRLDIKPWC
ncbi:hypothetical protein OZ411_33235 [Bradyrhizobium sp. Arg237L]|uniref:hypothetical protein n=1 Tax=Bradyrhizobium sp. Arg237L TaxID=3003352 RepID=UPI00249DA949|nr:hypothetical protein [Bradyrhizobium sp. Arg237L]MDI4237678.1 hypothetical protein [Bradyrhizobium sp. Arg237L]